MSGGRSYAPSVSDGGSWPAPGASADRSGEERGGGTIGGWGEKRPSCPTWTTRTSWAPRPLGPSSSISRNYQSVTWACRKDPSNKCLGMTPVGLRASGSGHSPCSLPRRTPRRALPSSGNTPAIQSPAATKPAGYPKERTCSIRHSPRERRCGLDIRRGLDRRQPPVQSRADEPQTLAGGSLTGR
jgi:hypothetical protein